MHFQTLNISFILVKGLQTEHFTFTKYLLNDQQSNYIFPKLVCLNASCRNYFGSMVTFYLSVLEMSK